MSNELVIPGLEIVNTPTVSDEQFLAVAKSGDWLPRLQLWDSQSKVVKQGLRKGGDFGVIKSKDEVTVLGQAFECILLSVRLTATRFVDNKAISYHDLNNPEFVKIVDTSDKLGFGCGCVYGPEFLLWIPKIEQFVTYHMNTKTGRRASGPMKALMGATCQPAACYLKSHFIETKQYSWWGPKAEPHTAPISPLPDGAKAMEQIKKFTSAPDAEVESTEGDATGGREV